MNVKKMTSKHPDKVMQRMTYIMAELGFLLDIFDFKKVNPKYQEVA
jgi:hypothetical protein